MQLNPSAPGLIQYGFGAQTTETHAAGGDIRFGDFVELRDGKVYASTAAANAFGVAVKSNVCSTATGYRAGQPVPVLTHGVITVRNAGALVNGNKVQMHASGSVVATGAAFAKIGVIAKQQATGDGFVDVQVVTL